MGETRNTKSARRASKRRKKSKSRVTSPWPKQQIASPAYTFYCDESGNTGLNYCDPDQPLYVVAGWLVPKSGDTKWKEALQKIKADNGQSELHGSKLSRNFRGQSLMVKVLQAGLQNGCLPFSNFAFKGFCLAGRFVDAFLDPFTNPAASWIPTALHEKRRELAIYLWENFPQAISRFGSHFKNVSHAEWRKTLLYMCECLSSDAKQSDERPLHPELLHSLSAAATPNILSKIVDEQTLYTLGKGSRLESMSLNLPFFIGLLRQIDAFARTTHTIDVVHDNCHRFERAFDDFVDLSRKAGRVDFPHIANLPVSFSPGSFRSFRTVDSKESLGVQAADILVHSIYQTGKSSISESELTPTGESLAALSLGHLPSLLRTGDFPAGPPGVGTDAELSKIYQLAHEAARKFYNV